MKVGFLIVNYNDFLNVNNLVNNIKNYKIIDKIVIVDNNSSNKEPLKKLDAKVIYEKKNLGYAHAINVGSQYLNEILGDCYIIISNADIIINNEETIKKLINTFNSDVAIVSPKVDEKNHINLGWKLPNTIDEIIFNIPFFGKIHRHNKENKNLLGINEIDVASGCFFIIDSRVLKKINYLDESTFLYYEENILSKKIKDINKKILINADVSVIHNHSVTIDKNINKIKKYKLQKQSQYYFCKNYNNANIIELLLLKLTYYITYIILYIYYKINDLKRLK